jgi:hypothetical protein
MDEFLGFGGLFDMDGDGNLDAGETAFGLMMMDDVLTDEESDDAESLDDDELELMTGYSRDDLEFMDSEERTEILEEAGCESDDFGFDDF